MRRFPVKLLLLAYDPHMMRECAIGWFYCFSFQITECLVTSCILASLPHCTIRNFVWESRWNKSNLMSVAINPWLTCNLIPSLSVHPAWSHQMEYEWQLFLCHKTCNSYVILVFCVSFHVIYSDFQRGGHCSRPKALLSYFKVTLLMFGTCFPDLYDNVYVYVLFSLHTYFKPNHDVSPNVGCFMVTRWIKNEKPLNALSWHNVLKMSFKNTYIHTILPEKNYITHHSPDKNRCISSSIVCLCGMLRHAQWWAVSSFNQRIGGSIPAPLVHVNVSLGKTRNPKMSPVLCLRCVNVCECWLLLMCRWERCSSHQCMDGCEWCHSVKALWAVGRLEKCRISTGILTKAT